MGPSATVWLPELAPPGTVTLLSGRLRPFFHELAHEALHTRSGNVLWCDGAHAFDPYDFAERNLTAGLAADDGAERMLVKRCMTPFQWYTTLARLLPEKMQADAALAIVHPFDALFSTDELADWEQEDYVRFLVPHLTAIAARTNVPILLGVDMPRWWRTHPALAQIAKEGIAHRWSVAAAGDRFRARRDDGVILDPVRRRTTLLDFETVDSTEIPAILPRMRPWRSKIVYEH